MNLLTKVLLEDLLEVKNKKVTAIYGGGFKPPTRGHFNVVNKAAEQNPEIDDFIICVGSGVRDGIGQPESVMIWEIYKKYLPLKVRIEPTKSPITYIFKYADEHPDEEILWVVGARENNPDDFEDIAYRTRTIDKYPNLKLRLVQTNGGESGTAARKAIKDNNKEQFFNLIPDIPEKEQVWDIVSPVITEGVMDNIKSKLKKFILAVKQENRETKEALGLLIKSAKGDIDLTEEQKKQIGDQLKDVLKLVGLTAIATLPGGFIAAALIKLFKAEHLVTPSSFVNEVNIHQKALSQTEKEALELTYKNWDTFGGKECNNGFCDIFAKNLSKYLPGSKIMSTEDPRNNTLGHVWVEYEGKYFDAETPNGVDSWKQLPWMIEFYSKNKSYPTDIENLNEVITDTEIICDNCGWKWAKKDGGNDLYICHKCGHDNAPKQLNENTIPSIDIKEKLDQINKYMISKGYNIEPLPTVEIIDNDKENAENYLGKTAYYDPNEKKIVLYTFGRHPKDISRSYTHEMIHHIQNLENRLGNITTTNTLEDDHLDKIEQEANLKGTMTFRNFTDSLNESKQVGSLYHVTTPQGLENILKTNTLKGSSISWDGGDTEFFGISTTRNKNFFYGNNQIQIVLDGDKISNNYKIRPYDYWRRKYDIPDEPQIKDEDEELIIVGEEGLKDIKKYILKINDFTDKNLSEAIVGNKTKDPFGLNAYARELALGLEETLNEGRYDSIVTQLARYTIKGWKDDQEYGEPIGRVEFEVGPGKDLEYGDLEFLYKGVAVFADVESYSHNGYARSTSGEVGLTFAIPTNELPRMWEQIYNDVTNTLRHEIEHLTQNGKNVKQNKAMSSDSDLRKKLDATGNTVDYYLLPKEIDANLQGLYLKAKKTRQPFAKVVDSYLKYNLNLSLDDQEKVKNAWRSRIKALSLPKI